MELRQLYYFTMCAQAGSFSRAAAALYTTQSNVSKVVRGLEQELGFELFERKQYGIALTQRGKQVYDYAQGTLGSADKILRYARSSQRGQLRIAANPDLWVSRVFCAYYRESGNADTKYSFLTGSTRRIIEQMEEGETDLGFVYITREQKNSLANRFRKSHLVFACLKTMPAVVYGRTANMTALGSEGSTAGYAGSSFSGSGQTAAAGDADTVDEDAKHLAGDAKHSAGDASGSVGTAAGDAKHLTGAAEPANFIPIDLVQCSDEDFSIVPARGNDDQAGADPAHYQVSVDTNDEMIIQELLGTTDLARISGDLYYSLPGDHAPLQNAMPSEQLLFGCLTRNDRNLDQEAIRFLKYIREKVKQN